tara:strand:+ start:2931 stop:3749 length:819 start_codon:yes stop_codon:yes gene_type:complete
MNVNLKLYNKIKNLVKIILGIPISKLDPKTIEKKELLKKERFKAGISNYFGFDMHYVDAPTFVHGGHEIIEKCIYEFKPKIEDPLIIDCGANIGLATLYFKKAFPKAKIIAFEPDPVICSTLKKNLEINSFEDVKVEQKAVWIHSDGVKFRTEGAFSGRIPKDMDKDKINFVESISLKEIINEPVQFLKLDIEGAENEVIFDIESKLKFVENLFIEYHSYYNEEQKLPEILQLLKRKGFRIHIQEAFVREKPFIDKETCLGMDLQLNIYCNR